MISKPLFASAACTLLAGSVVAAPINAPPPAGGRELIDMAQVGVTRQAAQPVPTLVSTRFVATSRATRFSFAMRADTSNFIDAGGGQHITGAEVFLDDASIQRVNPVTNVVLSGNLLTNGDFEGGSALDLTPNGWIFDQSDRFAPHTGLVTSLTPIPSRQPPPIEGGTSPVNDSFVSFSDNRYNALSQTIATIPGATYEIGFTVAFADTNQRNQFGIDTTDFLRLASFDTDGRQIADGLDLVLTATNAGPGTGDDGHVHFSALDGGGVVPEPATWAMMILGFAGMGALARRGRREAASQAV